MSMVNQMLKDLNQRQGNAGEAHLMTAGIVLTSPTTRHSRAPLLLLLLAAALATAGLLTWNRTHESSAPPSGIKVSTTTAPVTAVQPPPVPEAEVQSPPSIAATPPPVEPTIAASAALPASQPASQPVSPPFAPPVNPSLSVKQIASETIASVSIRTSTPPAALQAARKPTSPARSTPALKSRPEAGTRLGNIRNVMPVQTAARKSPLPSTPSANEVSQRFDESYRHTITLLQNSRPPETAQSARQGIGGKPDNNEAALAELPSAGEAADAPQTSDIINPAIR